ncbi:DUF3826 domain-containing protein [Sphingobacterium sp. InxBP1]|uniref:DUF3826 domain-containing protein n=1 Tax=Sphingobacterium sp. InxBP1 TaxID=2870328 RepID=UPI002243929D|nr:DUF3826 domain-containing protein [Sphingobacterium sp. InxBP1]MCW8312278.1 DUF3826 domain-containing protein [Sphingobacterium sp. InxBP1]
MKRFALLTFLFLSVSMTFGQTDDTYWKTITARSEKIVSKLALKDQTKREKTARIIRDQYYLLNACYVLRDLKIKENSELKEQINQETLQETGRLNQSFVQRLKAVLTEQEVEEVKNGMTYHVYPNTVKAYQEMIPRLTKEEIHMIDSLLFEARDYAMQAESSEKKHAWFGKYKGKINNYLASHGYNLKEEGDKWAERLKKQPK